MDKNKLKKLKDINYKINKSCSLCVYSKFNNNSDWGVCTLHSYEHIKHTKNPRCLSTNRSGYCKEFTIIESEEKKLESWKLFLHL